MEELSDATGVMEVDRTYSYGLDLIAQDRFDVGSSAWDATFYLYDGHGNVRALADDAGTITDTYDYDAFGTLIEQLVLDASASGLVPVTTDNRDLTTDNQYLYCGEQFDPDLGLYFLRARYMDTDRGRFWSMDIFEGFRHDPTSLHKYLYVRSSPVSYVDPSGYVTWHEMLTVASISGVINGTLAVVQGQSFLRGFAMGFVSGAIGGGAGALGSRVIGGALVGIAAGTMGALSGELIDLIDGDPSTKFEPKYIFVGALVGGATGGVAGKIGVAELEAAREFVHSLITGTSISLAVNAGVQVKTLLDEIIETFEYVADTL